MKIKIRKDNNLQPRFRDGWRGQHGPDHWEESEPYFVNPRGVLIHRVRSVRTYRDGEKVTHYSMTCLCGEQFGFHNLENLVAEPPEGRLLCARCESVAAEKGLPSSEELTGRHVHVGKLVAKQVCCQDRKDAN